MFIDITPDTCCMAAIARMAAAGHWAKPDTTMPLVVVGLVFGQSSTSPVRVKLHVITPGLERFRERLRMGNRPVALREFRLGDKSQCDMGADIVVAFIPDPEATRSVEVELRMSRVRPPHRWTWLDCLTPWRRWREDVRWTCLVQPAHVWPMTPLVGGVAPFPNSRYSLCGWRMDISCSERDMIPRILVGSMLSPYSMLLAPTLSMPGDVGMPAELRLLEESVGNGIGRFEVFSFEVSNHSLPDIDASLVDARRRELVTRSGPFRRDGEGFKELVEAVFAPARIARGLTEAAF